MSRTKKGSKGTTEYWSRRPGTSKSDVPGKFSKKVNTRMERSEAKKDIEEEFREFCPVCSDFTDIDASHYCDRCRDYRCECECGFK